MSKNLNHPNLDKKSNNFQNGFAPHHICTKDFSHEAANKQEQELTMFTHIQSTSLLLNNCAYIRQ